MFDIAENPLGGCYIALFIECVIVLWWLIKPYTFQKRYLWGGPLSVAVWVTISLLIVTDGEILKQTTKTVMKAFEVGEIDLVISYFHDDFYFAEAIDKANLTIMVNKTLSKPFVDNIYVKGLETADVSSLGGTVKVALLVQFNKDNRYVTYPMSSVVWQLDFKRDNTDQKYQIVYAELLLVGGQKPTFNVFK